MKKEKIKALPVVIKYAEYFIRRAKRVLKLKDVDIDHIGIDFIGRSGQICVWIHGKDKILARAQFESDGTVIDKYDNRIEEKEWKRVKFFL